MIKKVHIGGALKSKPDYRSAIIAAAMPVNPTPSLPASLYTNFYRKNNLVMMQNQTPSCVSHSWVYLMKLYWFLKTGKIVDFNPQFLHILSAFEGAGPDDGRDPATVAQVSQQIGCCTSATLPINTNVSNVQYCDPNVITQAMRDEAAQYKIPGYVQIEITQMAIRQGIQTYGAVSMCWSIGTEFYTAPDGTESWAQADIDPLRPPVTIIGGHEVTGDGWNDIPDHIINEWSPAWAQQGESDYLFSEWQSFIQEAWAIAEVPGPALATVQGLPAPDEFIHNFNQQINQGDTSDEVRALQIALSIDGFNTYPEITGFYGPLTAASVLAFQISKNVAPLLELQSLNGSTVGPATQTALNVLYNT